MGLAWADTYPPRTGRRFIAPTVDPKLTPPCDICPDSCPHAVVNPCHPRPVQHPLPTEVKHCTALPTPNDHHSSWTCTLPAHAHGHHGWVVRSCSLLSVAAQPPRKLFCDAVPLVAPSVTDVRYLPAAPIPCSDTGDVAGTPLPRLLQTALTPTSQCHALPAQHPRRSRVIVASAR